VQAALESVLLFVSFFSEFDKPLLQNNYSKPDTS